MENNKARKLNEITLLLLRLLLEPVKVPFSNNLSSMEKAIIILYKPLEKNSQEQ
jgi:hypothetical protein